MPGKDVVEDLTYRVVFTKEGNDWSVVAPEVHPAHSWGPNLRAATKRIKEAIALVLDLPKGAEEALELDAEYRLDGLQGDDEMVFRDAREARLQLHAAQKCADDALRLAIERGRARGLSVRDLAIMTGVSHQRVAQIASGR